MGLIDGRSAAWICGDGRSLCFLAAVGLPLPMSITLLAAGAASRHGLSLAVALMAGVERWCCRRYAALFWRTVYGMVVAFGDVPCVDESRAVHLQFCGVLLPAGPEERCCLRSSSLGSEQWLLHWLGH